jgi:dTMP kinase
MRGLFIAFEGIDRSGKSTQISMLMRALQQHGKRCTSIHFPMRETWIGNRIDEYLKRKNDSDDRTIHLLFSANRWEYEKRIRQDLCSGISVICDRYAYSGVAFTAAKRSASLEWCKASDTGLPRPDIVIYLQISADITARRPKYGRERYESVEFQREVCQKYDELRDDNWFIVDASWPIDVVHARILNHVNRFYDDVVAKQTVSSLALRELWV